jgi:hypothetical protein
LICCVVCRSIPQRFTREIGLATVAGYHHLLLLLLLLFRTHFAFVANKNLLRAIVAIFASCKFFLSFVDVVVGVLLKLYDEAKLTMTHEIGFRSLLVNLL